MITSQWHPLFHLDRLQQDMNRLFDRYSPGESRERRAYPPINVHHGPDGVALSVRLPGYSPDQVDITTNRNSVVIRGNRSLQELEEGQVRQANERHTGEFVRTFELPFAADPDKTSATFSNGVLLVSLGRPEEEKPRKVQVKAAN